MKNEIVVKCSYCEKELGNLSIKLALEKTEGAVYIGAGRFKYGYFCNEECYNKYKEKFEIEQYHNCSIYGVTNNNDMYYMPYWGSNYYFTNIDDCKKRIDSKVAIT